MGVQMSISSPYSKSLFLPLHIVHTCIIVHVGFEYMFISFILEKKTVQNIQDIIQILLYFHVSLFCFFQIVCNYFSTVLQKIK